MGMILSGFGTACPEHSIEQADAAELHATFCRIDSKRSRTLKALYRRAGVSRRHSAILDASSGPIEARQSFYPPAHDDEDPGPSTQRRMGLYETAAPELAVRASRKALAAADTAPGEVSHVVTVSCTGFIAPGLDAHVVSALGLPAGTRRTHVGFMGCNGALNGLRVAKSFVEAEPEAVVVLCAVELCSLHFAYGWDPEMLVPNALFADGAAAVVGRSSTTASGEWAVTANGTVRFADSADDMTWRIGNHGFRMTLSPRVPDLIEGQLGAWLDGWLSEQGLAAPEVASWAVHPGGPRLLTSVERAMTLSRDQTGVSRDVLSEHGNMSSATVLFILDRLKQAGAPLPCVALAFGPGLVAEAVLVT